MLKKFHFTSQCSKSVKDTNNTFGCSLGSERLFLLSFHTLFSSLVKEKTLEFSVKH